MFKNIKSILVSVVFVSFVIPSISSAQLLGDTSTNTNNTPTCLSLTTNLSKGQSDTTLNGDIYKLQSFLNDTGFFPDAQLSDTQPAVFGKITQKAVMAFQAQMYSNVLASDIDNILSASDRQQLASTGFPLTQSGNVFQYTRAKIKYLSCHGATPVAVSTGSTNSTSTNSTTITTPTLTLDNTTPTAGQTVNLTFHSNGASSCTMPISGVVTPITDSVISINTAGQSGTFTQVATCHKSDGSTINSNGVTYVVSSPNTTTTTSSTHAPSLTANGNSVSNGGTVTIPYNGSVLLGFSSGSNMACTLGGNGSLVSNSNFNNQIGYSSTVNSSNAGSYTYTCPGGTQFAFNVVAGTQTTSNSRVVTLNANPISNGDTIAGPADGSPMAWTWDFGAGTYCTWSLNNGSPTRLASPSYGIASVGVNVISCAGMTPFTFTIVTGSQTTAPTLSINTTTPTAGQTVNLTFHSNGASSCTMPISGVVTPITDSVISINTAGQSGTFTQVATCHKSDGSTINSNGVTYVVSSPNTTTTTSSTHAPSLTANGNSVSNGGTVTIPYNGSVLLGFSSGSNMACTLGGNGSLVSNSNFNNQIGYSSTVNSSNAGSYTYTCPGGTQFAFNVVVGAQATSNSSGAVASVTLGGHVISSGDTVVAPADGSLLPWTWFFSNSGAVVNCTWSWNNGPASSFFNPGSGNASVGINVISCTGMTPFTFTVVASPSASGNTVAPVANSVTATSPTITLSKDSDTISFGNTSTITWIVSPTTSTCVVAGGNLTSGDVPANSGTWTTPNLYTTTQYGIRCVNGNSQPITKYFTVNVQNQTSSQSGAPTITLSPDTTIPFGGTATITWAVTTIPSTDIIYVTCYAAGGNLGAGGPLQTNGTATTVNLYTNTQFGIRCVNNSNGLYSYKYINITVSPEVASPCGTLNGQTVGTTLLASKTYCANGGQPTFTSDSPVAPANGLYKWTCGSSPTICSGTYNASLGLLSTQSQVLGASTKNICINLNNHMSLGITDKETSGEVTRLQLFLKERGYFKEDLTGIFGKVTEQSVKSFQTDKNLIVTGQVGQVTRDSIRTLSCGN